MKKSILFITALSLIVFAAGAMAATDTNQLDVQANVNNLCNIQSVTDVDFVDYDPTSGTPDDDGTGNVTFACTKNTSYDLYITGARTITDGSDTISYELYTDVGRSSLFPSAIPGVQGPALDNNPISQDIFGRIPAGQDVQAGLYVGQVTITVEY